MMGSKSRMQGKKLPEPSAQAKVYLGIDVCKARLDVYVHPLGHRLRVANSREGLKQLRRELAGCGAVLAVIEATGKYHRLAHRKIGRASSRERVCKYV